MFVVHNENTRVIVCFDTSDELCKALPNIMDDSDYLLTFIYEGELGQPMKDVTKDYLVVKEKE